MQEIIKVAVMLFVIPKWEEVSVTAKDGEQATIEPNHAANQHMDNGMKTTKKDSHELLMKLIIPRDQTDVMLKTNAIKLELVRLRVFRQ